MIPLRWWYLGLIILIYLQLNYFTLLWMFAHLFAWAFVGICLYDIFSLNSDLSATKLWILSELTPKMSSPPFGEFGGDYKALSTCSLICSSSSFIMTTIFCISAWLLLDPVVLISRPISWAMKPSFCQFRVHFHALSCGSIVDGWSVVGVPRWCRASQCSR